MKNEVENITIIEGMEIIILGEDIIEGLPSIINDEKSIAYSPTKLFR